MNGNEMKYLDENSLEYVISVLPDERKKEILKEYYEKAIGNLAEKSLQIKNNIGDVESLKREREIYEKQKKILQNTDKKLGLGAFPEYQSQQSNPEADEIEKSISMLKNHYEELKNELREVVDNCKFLDVSNENTDFKKLVDKLGEQNKNIKTRIDYINELNKKLPVLFAQNPELADKYKNIQNEIIYNTRDKVKDQCRVLSSKILDLQIAIYKNPNNEKLIVEYNELCEKISESRKYLKNSLENSSIFESIQEEIAKELYSKSQELSELIQKSKQGEPITSDNQGETQGEQDEEIIRTVNTTSLDIDDSNNVTPNPSGSELNQQQIQQPEPIQQPEQTPEQIQQPEPVHQSEQTPEPVTDPKQEQTSSPTAESTPEQNISNQNSESDRIYPEITDEEIRSYQALIVGINNCISRINTLIEQEYNTVLNPELIDLNSDLSPNRNQMKKIAIYEKAISRESDKIFELEMKKSDFEFELLKSKMVLITLDSRVKNININNIKYEDNIEENVKLHYSKIEEAYKKIEILSEKIKTIGKEYVAQYQEAIDELLEFINAEKDIIDRRVLAEKRLNPSFDIIGFYSTHRINPQKNEQVITQNEQKPVTSEQNSQPEGATVQQTEPVQQSEQTPEPKVEQPVINMDELEENFKKDYAKNYYAYKEKCFEKETLYVEPLTDEEYNLKSSELHKQRQELIDSDVALRTKYKEISEETQMKLVKAINEEIDKKFEENYADKKEKIKENEQSLLEFKKCYQKIADLAKKCQENAQKGLKQDYIAAYTYLVEERKNLIDEISIAGNKMSFENVNNDNQEFRLIFSYGQGETIESPVISCVSKNNTLTNQQVNTPEINVSTSNNLNFGPVIQTIPVSTSIMMKNVDAKIAKQRIPVKIPNEMMGSLDKATIVLQDKDQNVIGTVDIDVPSGPKLR